MDDQTTHRNVAMYQMLDLGSHHIAFPALCLRVNKQTVVQNNGDLVRSTQSHRRSHAIKFVSLPTWLDANRRVYFDPLLITEVHSLDTQGTLVGSQQIFE